MLIQSGINLRLGKERAGIPSGRNGLWLRKRVISRVGCDLLIFILVFILILLDFVPRLLCRSLFCSADDMNVAIPLSQHHAVVLICMNGFEAFRLCDDQFIQVR